MQLQAARVGNNRGDTKVLNAPVNVFGRAHRALTESEGQWTKRATHYAIDKMACVFPGDPSAELNLIPADWVVNGIIARHRHSSSSLSYGLAPCS